MYLSVLFVLLGAYSTLDLYVEFFIYVFLLFINAAF